MRTLLLFQGTRVRVGSPRFWSTWCGVFYHRGDIEADAICDLVPEADKGPVDATRLWVFFCRYRHGIWRKRNVGAVPLSRAKGAETRGRRSGNDQDLPAGQDVQQGVSGLTPWYSSFL